MSNVKASAHRDDASTTSTPARSLDVRGLYCPIPVMKAKKALQELSKGQVLEILTTDPSAKIDIPAWAWKTGQELLKTEDCESFTRFLVARRR